MRCGLISNAGKFCASTGGDQIRTLSIMSGEKVATQRERMRCKGGLRGRRPAFFPEPGSIFLLTASNSSSPIQRGALPPHRRSDQRQNLESSAKERAV